MAKDKVNDNAVAGSLCPVMTRPMMVPGGISPLGGPQVTIKAVEHPCVTTCMLYLPPKPEDITNGNTRGHCRLARLA